MSSATAMSIVRLARRLVPVVRHIVDRFYVNTSCDLIRDKAPERAAKMTKSRKASKLNHTTIKREGCRPSPSQGSLRSPAASTRIHRAYRCGGPSVRSSAGGLATLIPLLAGEAGLQGDLQPARH